jgi:UDP-glucuronate 4-epimerase
MPVLCASDDESSSNQSGSAGSSQLAEKKFTPSSMNRAESTVCFSDIEEEQTPVAPHVGYKKVLVTGGAGFIGSNVAELLLSRGDDVVIIDEMNDYYDVKIKEANLQHLRSVCPDEKRLTIYRGDICDEDLMTSIFEKEQPKWGKLHNCHTAFL